MCGVTSATIVAPHLLTVGDCAGRLSVSASFVRRLLAARKLAPVRLGRLVRIDEADLEKAKTPQKTWEMSRVGNRAQLRQRCPLGVTRLELVTSSV